MSTVQLNTFEVLFSLPYAPRGLHCLQLQLPFPLLSSLFRYLLGSRSPLHIELITSSLPTPALSRPRHVWPPLLLFLFFYFFIPFRFADQMFNSNYASSINLTWKQRGAVLRSFTIQKIPSSNAAKRSFIYISL